MKGDKILVNFYQLFNFIGYSENLILLSLQRFRSLFQLNNSNISDSELNKYDYNDNMKSS
jgi:hypothetical protein